jgi:cytochrome c551/c552
VGFVLTPFTERDIPKAMTIRKALLAIIFTAFAGSAAAQEQRAVFNQYCVTCHNEKLKTAGLMLDRFDVAKIDGNAAVWEKVLQKLRAGSMPPAGLARPDKATYDSLASYLQTELDRAAAAKPDPGRPAVHRLNRAEYTNAVRDLLAIDTDALDFASLLPADDAAYGFDNIGDMLAVSPALLERYLSASEKVTRLAIGDLNIPPVIETIGIPESLKQDKRMSDALPAGSRGGIAIRHYFPVDGEYVIKVRLQRDALGAIVGITEPKQIDARLDGARIRMFNIGGERKGKSDDVGADFEYLSTADSELEVRFPAKAGSRLLEVTYLKDTIKSENGPGGRIRGGTVDGLESVTLSGPYNPKGLGETPSRLRILTCHSTTGSEEESCAKKILSTVSRRAYRRPVTDEDVRPLLNLYKVGRSTGGFETGIRTALQGILVDPEFLFRIERDPAAAAPDTAYRISDLELASRLSFFLWSSIPDDELLGLAEQGRLKDSTVLEQQVRRMLRDSRSKALVSNFAGQWLYLRNLRTKLPDPRVYPDFDENLRQAMEQETELFFDSIIREDRSVVDLLSADYTFVNERLAQHYGIPNIRGSHFRRITLHDENRQGLLGQASILMVTSYATRTAPTLRGKWLLENLLGAPPPPPPPNVPSLKDDRNANTLTMRQRMEQHRANPACASCHKLMDPLGFALENFDAVGKWRLTQDGSPIDVSGELPDGTKFQGPSELRNILLSKREQFVDTVSEKLLTYALGRGIEYYDMPAIRKIVHDAAPAGYRWSSIVLGIVESTPFQMRKAKTPNGEPGAKR